MESITNAVSLLRGDCIEQMRTLPTGTVRTCVTSPPYFGLRDYQHERQIGLEDTPEAYISRLVQVFREVYRLLAADGTLWLNIGDSYASKPNGPKSLPKEGSIAPHVATRTAHARRSSKVPSGMKHKDLIGIPWMLAFALRADGWHLRQDIIWHKPNPMPESVRDRCTKAHEYIFLLSKSEKYYYDYEAVKEPAKEWYGRAATFDRGSNPVASHVLPGQSEAQHRPRPSKKRGEFNGKTEEMAAEGRNAFRAITPTRNRRSVWTVATRPYKGAHFATFPPALIEPCILAGSRPGDIVLDPFNGSGTTGQVALQRGRRYIGIDLNPDYLDLTRERLAQASLSRNAA